jgi:hypothetical protein
MQCLNNGFNKFKVDDLTYVKFKNVDSSKNVKKIIKPFKYNYKILNCMCLIYYNMCKMQLVSNGFNILKINGSTFMVEKM